MACHVWSVQLRLSFSIRAEAAAGNSFIRGNMALGLVQASATSITVSRGSGTNNAAALL